MTHRSPHGTIGAYRRHIRAGQRACTPCLQANAAYARAWAARDRAQRQVDRDLQAVIHVLACALGVGRGRETSSA